MMSEIKASASEPKDLDSIGCPNCDPRAKLLLDCNKWCNHIFLDEQVKFITKNGAKSYDLGGVYRITNYTSFCQSFRWKHLGLVTIY